ncbi:MAG: hypothetical protein ACRD47_01585 [Nitrososphaeraceae archaeon]
MVKKYGIDIDEADKEREEATEEYARQLAAGDWSYDKLLEKYIHLKEIALENLPNIWPGLEFALSVKTILNIIGCTLPFAGILLGPASSQKTLIIECFRGAKNTFYSDNFTPKSFVSHISGKTDKQLRDTDLLPKLKDKLFMTPELAPIISARDDDLMQLMGILTRVLDGRGYESDTGACGHRGYDEDIMFVMLGAAIDISPKVYKALSTLGPKLYFFRMNRIEDKEDDYFNRRNHDFGAKRDKVRTALLEYLAYFDMNPDAEIQRDLTDFENEDGVRKIALDPDKDEELPHRVIIRMALALARLRALVPTWETGGAQGSEYSYRMANPEDPSRAITQLTNLAKGHALSMGRRHITLEDIPVIIHTALSTASMERVRIFELLIEHKGVLTTSDICESLNTTPPTARRTMTELKATGLVTMETGEGQTPSSIRLDQRYDWFTTDEFASIKAGKIEDLQKEKYPPQKGALPVSYDESNGNGKCKGSDTHIGTLSGGEISFSKIALSDKVEEYFRQSSQYPKATIHDSYVSVGGGYAILLRSATDVLFSRYHPGILDGSLKIEFVTGKTNTNATVRFLNRQTTEYGYYYSCYHCYDISRVFGSIDEYERHIVSRHKPGTVGYPGGPDIERIELDRVRKKQGKSKVAEAAAANLSGNGLLGNDKGNGT